MLSKHQFWMCSGVLAVNPLTLVFTLFSNRNTITFSGTKYVCPIMMGLIAVRSVWISVAYETVLNNPSHKGDLNHVIRRECEKIQIESGYERGNVPDEKAAGAKGSTVEQT